MLIFRGPWEQHVSLSTIGIRQTLVNALLATQTAIAKGTAIQLVALFLLLLALALVKVDLLVLGVLTRHGFPSGHCHLFKQLLLLLLGSLAACIFLVKLDSFVLGFFLLFDLFVD